MHLAIETYALLTVVAFIAGFIDAIAGGGGLLTVPAMLSAGVPPIATLATNKLQSSFSSATATFNFSRKGLIDWRTYWPQVVMILILSGLGAWIVQSIKTDVLKLIVPVLLVAVAAYVLLSPRMSDEDVHHRLGTRGYLPVGGAIGFYDGFFGPGTGSFFATSLVSLRGMGLIRATAHTKAFNFSSNFGSLIVFLSTGHAMILLGLCMAVGAASGAWTGSHTAIRFGAKVIRPVLVTICLALTAKLLWDALS
ncbi:TSUP family transporter [Rhizorhabdus histidinilytica]|uniref:TSUP family transporter n=1 Tax=Rhizorhabdus histidinilytica TaxID=439228 RepID=UPI0032208486